MRILRGQIEQRHSPIADLAEDFHACTRAGDPSLCQLLVNLTLHRVEFIEQPRRRKSQ